jgi:hypothetical protein
VNATRRVWIEHVAATGAIARLHLAPPPAGQGLPRGHLLSELEVDARALSRIWQYRVEGSGLVLDRAAIFRATVG